MTTPTTCEATEEQRAIDLRLLLGGCRVAREGHMGDHRQNPHCIEWSEWSLSREGLLKRMASAELRAQALAQESARLAGYIREAKHLISVRMEGFPCADGDACENLKTLQGIAAALDGKEI